MSKPRVYVSEVANPGVLARLGEVCEVRSWLGPGKCPAEVLEREVSDLEAVVGDDRWTAALMDRAPSLRLIAFTKAGFDEVDVAAATERGIIVTNTPDVLNDTVADMVFALLLDAARRVSEMDRWVRAGNWRTLAVPFMGQDVHHRVLGVLGLGRIGSVVARRGLGFDMKVLYHDRVRREEQEQRFGYQFVDLDTLLKESDFLTISTTLTPETRGMIGAAQLAKMKPTAFLVNIARGAVVDENALILALQEKRIAGAGLDVFAKEPIDPENPLLKMDNVVLIPHVGSATETTRLAMINLAIDNTLAVLQGGRPLTPVNPEVLSRLKR